MFLNQRDPDLRRRYRLGEYLPRDLSKIIHYNVPFKQFAKFTNFQGIGLVKTLYISAIIFVTVFSILQIALDWISGDSTEILLGLVFTSIFWFVSLIFLRVMAECVISCISLSHLVPLLSKRHRDLQLQTLALTTLPATSPYDFDEDYDLGDDYDPPPLQDEPQEERKHNKHETMEIHMNPNETLTTSDESDVPQVTNHGSPPDKNTQDVRTEFHD